MKFSDSSTIAGLLAVIVSGSAFVASSLSAQILSFHPARDTVTLVTYGDIGPALMYTIDSSTTGIDSINVFGYGQLFAPSFQSGFEIAYCTFVVRDSAELNSYHLTFSADHPSDWSVVNIPVDQFVGVQPDSGFLTLRVFIADSAYDSMSVRFVANFDHAGSVDGEVAWPDGNVSVMLLPNYPNPFNGQTTIPYFLSREQNVSLSLASITGQHIRTFLSGFQTAGSHTLHFDAADLPSGVYYVKLSVSGYIRVSRITLLR